MLGNVLAAEWVWMTQFHPASCQQICKGGLHLNAMLFIQRYKLTESGTLGAPVLCEGSWTLTLPPHPTYPPGKHVVLPCWRT